MFNIPYRERYFGELRKAIETDVRGSCKLLEALPGEVVDERKTSKTAVYSSTIRWKSSSEDDNVTKVFVKRLTIGFPPQFPKNFLNEMYISKEVVGYIFETRQSPHFVYPIAQVVTSGTGPSDIRDVVQFLWKNLSSACKGEGDNIYMYNVSEYVGRENSMTLRDFMKMDVEDKDLHLRNLRQVMFQVLYNLALMEKLELRHGDLHYENILIVPLDSPSSPIHYAVDDEHSFRTTPSVFTLMIDFDRSYIHGEKFQTINLNEKEAMQFPCIPSDQIPLSSSFKETCQSWNPHGDWTRLFASLFNWILKRKGDDEYERIFEGLFPSVDLQNSIMKILIDFERFPYGRPSYDDIMETSTEEDIDVVRPENLFRTYAEQWIDETDGWVSKISLGDRKEDEFLFKCIG